MLLQSPRPQSSSGGSGSGNSVAGTVDFGSSPSDLATATIAAAWVTTGSVIVTQVVSDTADHPDAEEAVIEELVATVGNIVDGVSFDVFVYAPNGTTGQYTVNCIEV